MPGMDNARSEERSDGLDQRVISLEDLSALQKLKSTYAFDVDRCFVSPSHDNAVAAANLFTDGAVADYGILGRYEGRAQLLNAFENVFPGMASWTTHYITNPVLTQTADAAARGEWYFLVYVVFKGAPAGPPTNIWGHYTERYVRTPTGWKIASLLAEYFTPPPSG